MRRLQLAANLPAYQFRITERLVLEGGKSALRSSVPIDDEWELDPAFAQGGIAPTTLHVGALQRWRKELRAGGRGNPDRPVTWLLDHLWKAACKEASALELKAAGNLQAARRVLDEAAVCLRRHDQRSTPPRDQPRAKPTQQVASSWATLPAARGWR